MAADIAVGLHFGYHDSAVTFADEDRVLLHLEAERVFGEPHKQLGSDAELQTLVQAGLHALRRSADDLSHAVMTRGNNPAAGRPWIRLVGRRLPAQFVGHHRAHIACAQAALGAVNALVYCSDGGSEDGLAGLYELVGTEVRLVEKLDHLPLSGRFYGTLTQLVIHPDFLLAHSHYGGKTMGLCGLGERQDEVRELVATHASEIDREHENGLAPLSHLFGLGTDGYARPWEDQRRCDLARAGQEFWTREVLRTLDRHAGDADVIALVGGSALNVLANSAVAERFPDARIVTVPCPGDSGESLGALLTVQPHLRVDFPYLGRRLSEAADVPPGLVDDLVAGRIVAWAHGRAEAGPRALGHRSLLCLPRVDLTRHMSRVIKGREPYRPVAPMLLEEDAERYFGAPLRSPYMSFAPRATEALTGEAPGVVHVDGSARAQTVGKDNPLLHSLLEAVKERTGCGVLANTSFNAAGAAMVDSDADARRTASAQGVDVLYVGDRRIARTRATSSVVE